MHVRRNPSVTYSFNLQPGHRQPGGCWCCLAADTQVPASRFLCFLFPTSRVCATRGHLRAEGTRERAPAGPVDTQGSASSPCEAPAEDGAHTCGAPGSLRPETRRLPWLCFPLSPRPSAFSCVSFQGSSGFSAVLGTALGSSAELLSNRLRPWQPQAVDLAASLYAEQSSFPHSRGTWALELYLLSTSSDGDRKPSLLQPSPGLPAPLELRPFVSEQGEPWDGDGGLGPGRADPGCGDRTPGFPFCLLLTGVGVL